MKMKSKLNMLSMVLLISILVLTNNSTTLGVQLNGTIPTISGTVNLEFTNPGELHTLNWSVVDENIKNYELFLDNIIVSTNEWLSSGTSDVETYVIEYDIKLDVGNYEFTLTVYDYNDLQSSFTTTVSIISVNSSPDTLPIDLSSTLLGFMMTCTILWYKRRIR